MATALAAVAPLLEVRDVHVALGGRPVLTGAGVTVAAGEVVGLAGPNGAGKSTLLRAVTRVVGAKRGTFLLRGTPIEARSRLDFAREVAVVQQLPEAPASMRVEELVLLGRHPHLRLLGRESGRDRAIALEAMRRAGCEAFAQRELGTLSGGERRRAFIARALAQEPRLLLLDEPTANLDAGAQGEVFELLRALTGDRVGVLVVVHDLTLAASYCDRLVLMQGGHTVAEGPPAEVVTAETVRRVYGDRVAVITHPSTGAPLVVPAVARMENLDA